MSNFLNILAQTDTELQSGTLLLAVEGLIAIGGVTLLSVWIAYGGLGELKNSPVRRNWLPYYMPFAVIFVWIALGSILLALKDSLSEDTAGLVVNTVEYGGMMLLSLLMVAAMLVLAKLFFARGIKGFGLGFKGIGKEAGWAVVNFITVMPLIWLGLAVVEMVGKLIAGDGFAIETHETLLAVGQIDAIWMKILIAVQVVVITAVFEEMMFRGFLQSMVAGFFGNRWIAIIMTSVFFTVMHLSKTHWLALFALSICLGYAYEKNGSLWRPIFIHAIFNGISIGMTLAG